MDEQHVRQAVCRASHELWLRGLVAGDAGLVCVELNRRRYVVLPPGVRKANPQLHQARDVDLDGTGVGTGRGGGRAGLPPQYWRPCMAAFRVGAPGSDAPGDEGPTVHACVIAQPVSIMALLHKAGDANDLTLASGRTLPILDPADDNALADAVGEAPGLGLRGVGLFVPAATLDRALNRAERLEHDAAVTLAAR